jgi:hypothetical protein
MVAQAGPILGRPGDAIKVSSYPFFDCACRGRREAFGLQAFNLPGVGRTKSFEIHSPFASQLHTIQKHADRSRGLGLFRTGSPSMRRLAGCLAFGACLIGLLVAPTAEAAKPGAARRAKPPKPPAVAPVKTGLFKALADKQVMASFVPRDAEIARVSLLNVSSTPLEVELPSVFAGAPVVALANLQPGNPYLSASSDSPVPQILGSVIPTSYANSATPPAKTQQPKAQPSTQLTTDDGPRTTLVLQPKQIRQFAVPCVCLQYGNPTPRPDVPYKLVALDSVSKSPQLRSLLDEFSLGRVDQPVVQLAAWHFSNNLSWDQLGDTGFATGRLGEAQGLATLIETDVNRKRTQAGSQPSTNNPTPPGD